MDKLERDIERGLVNLIKKHGGLCLKWVCPGWAGVPDRICLLPHGLIVFVEVKRPSGGKISERQKWFEKRLRGLGFRFCYCLNQQGLDRMKAIIKAEERERDAEL